MGYTTEFMGKLDITPPLPGRIAEALNEFCEARHGGNVSHAGWPSYWCDWEVSEDGTKLYWNGSEKSYSMDEWLKVLIKTFFKPFGHKVTGRILAQGESRGDVWTMEVGDDQIVKVVELKPTLGITNLN